MRSSGSVRFWCRCRSTWVGGFLVAPLDSAVSGWPVPAGGPRVVIDVIGPPQVILAPLPAGREPALGIFEGAQRAARAGMGRCPIAVSARGRHAQRPVLHARLTVGSGGAVRARAGHG